MCPTSEYGKRKPGGASRCGQKGFDSIRHKKSTVGNGLGARNVHQFLPETSRHANLKGSI